MTSSSDSASTRRRIGIPATQTSASIAPWRSSVPVTTARAASRSDRSHTTPSLHGAVARHSAMTASRRASRRATPTTVVPRAASACAVAAPMPEDAPVTTAMGEGATLIAATRWSRT